MNKGQSLFALAQLVAMIFVLSFAASAQQATEAVRRKALSEEARKFIAQNAEALGISKQPDAGKAGEPFSAAAPAIPFVYRYVSALAISPDFATDRTVFAAVYNGGVFKSTDAGLTWTAMNNGLDNFRVQALEVSPNFTVDQTLFVGTSDPPGAVGRTYRSTDGGGSWIKLTTGFAPSRVEDFAFSPDYASDQTIFAAAPGITKSTDGGNTWNSISPGGGRAVSIGLSPQYSFDQTIYMGTIWDLQKSTDDGNTWETLLSIGIGLPGDEFGDIAVSPNYAVDSTLFVTYPFGLLRSQDAG